MDWIGYFTIQKNFNSYSKINVHFIPTARDQRARERTLHSKCQTNITESLIIFSVFSSVHIEMLIHVHTSNSNRQHKKEIFILSLPCDSLVIYRYFSLFCALTKFFSSDYQSCLYQNSVIFFYIWNWSHQINNTKFGYFKEEEEEEISPKW